MRGICVLEAGRHDVLKKDQRVWGVLHHQNISCQANTLCADDEAHSAILPLVVAHVQQHPEGLWLLRLGASPEESPLWRQLPQLSPLSCYVDKSAVVSIFDCSRSFEEFQSRLPAKFLKDLRRRKRRLSEREGVSFTTITSLEAGFTDAYRTFLEVEASGWKGERGERSALLCAPRKVAYFETLGASIRSPSDHCVITLLHAEGRCIAASFSIRTGTLFSFIKIGYDENYDKFSPGSLLTERMIEDCCQDPDVEWLDMASEAQWALRWQPNRVQLQRCWVSIAPQPLRPIIKGLLHLRFGPVRQLVHRLRTEKKER